MRAKMSRNLTESDITQIKALISEERLGTFRNLTQTDDNAIELYQATMMLGGALMSVTGVVEVALRNAVCNQLQANFGIPDWLRNPPANFSWAESERTKIRNAEKQAQRDAYSKLSNADKQALDANAYPHGVPPNIRHSQLAKARQRTINVSEGQIISQLTIFFWKRLFSEHYERTLWKRSLKRVFPNKTYSRAKIAENLETIYQIRNRLAHHEPVYGVRLVKIVEAIDFVTKNLNARIPNPESPTAKLILPHREQLDSQISVFRITFDRLTKDST